MAIMTLLAYVFHIGAGTIALAAGLVAAFALKGGLANAILLLGQYLRFLACQRSRSLPSPEARIRSRFP